MNNFEITVIKDSKPHTSNVYAFDAIAAVNNIMYENFPIPEQFSLDVKRVPVSPEDEKAKELNQALQIQLLRAQEKPRVGDCVISPDGEGWITGFTDNAEAILSSRADTSQVDDILVNQAGVAVAALDYMNSNGSWQIRRLPFAERDIDNKTSAPSSPEASLCSDRSLTNMSLNHRLAKLKDTIY